eukprot:403361760
MGKKRSNSQFTKTMIIILQIIYVILTVLVLLMFLLRVLVLTYRNGEVDFTVFPDNCSSWAIDSGCTRVSRKAEQCVRIKTIKDSYPIYFQKYYVVDGNQTPLQQIFIECINNVGLNTIKYPKENIDPTKTNLYTHLYVETPFWGLIDDMYIRMIDNFGQNFYIEAQSQLRLGSYDFMVNYDNVESFYKCMKQMTNENINPDKKACS